MEKQTVTFFEPYPFVEGQKIRIDGGKRQGDWLVAGVGDTKVTLRCPISGREFEWARFCYHVRDDENVVWPSEE